jgi:hypothetical protein
MSQGSMSLQHGSGRDFLRARTVPSGTPGVFEDALVLTLLLRADAA